MVKKFYGYTLLEVLVSLFLLSLLMLGLNSIQAVSLRNAHSASYSAIAAMQLQSMAERLKLLNDNEITEQVTYWNNQNKSMLPQGRGTVSGHFPSYHVVIYWGQTTQQCNELSQGLSGCLSLDVNLI